uniref:WD repeat domain 75 n=1 Tax=Cynoglossus semilaevis TaxID=244447 RepID=A0A3P8WNG5_CYNSE
MVGHGEIRVVHRGGSKLHFRAPTISADSCFLACASGDCVKVFSTSTEECIHHLRGHTDLVTGTLLRPSNHLQLYSCSLDGTIRLWDFTDGILIKTFVVNLPIYSMVASAKHEGVVFVVTPTHELFQLVAVQLPPSPQQQGEVLDLSAVIDDVSSNPAATAFGREGEFIASVKGSRLEVYFFRKEKSFSLKENNEKNKKNTFTCVACHPKDDCIATGHEDGKIRLWRNLNQKKEYTYLTLHWHHAAVSSLCFTPQGTNLLSGGVESVLVQWRYKQENQKDFLPRLGGAITHISVSPDGVLFCTSHSDNKITVIKNNVKVSAVIQGLVKGERVRTDLLVDPRSKVLVLNGRPGHLQFYSLQRDKLLYNLDIVQQEFIHEDGLQQFEVVHAAFNSSGNWLATVEERQQKSADVELHLKLWAFQEQTQSSWFFWQFHPDWAPHEAQVTALSFCPSADHQTTMLVSTSKDGHFKAWAAAPDAHAANADAPDHTEGPSWSCDFVGTYHGLVPERCCFSADGSLLAVSFQKVVTLWNPNSWELVTTLSQPPGTIRHLCFGRLSCSKYLLGTTSENLLCCWNLLTCTLEWSTAVETTLLLDDPRSENVAAFSFQEGNTDLFVFKPNEPRPLFSHKAVCSGRVARAVFAPREELLEACEESSQWLNLSQLYFLTPHMDLMTFTTKVEEERLMASSKPLVINDSVAETPFSLLLGKHRRQHENEERVLSGSLLQTPAHVLPSTSFLCSMFVQSLLVSVTDSRSEEMASDNEEEDSEEEMEPSSRSERAPPPTDSTAAATAVAAPALTKAELRELKRVRRLDLSWLSGVCS